jgi:hypothetical protein
MNNSKCGFYCGLVAERQHKETQLSNLEPPLARTVRIRTQSTAASWVQNEESSDTELSSVELTERKKKLLLEDRPSDFARISVQRDEKTKVGDRDIQLRRGPSSQTSVLIISWDEGHDALSYCQEVDPRLHHFIETG